MEVQVTKFKKYKTWDPKVRLYIVIVLSCPLISSLVSSTTNQMAAQNNCYIEPDFGNPTILLLKLFYLYIACMHSVKGVGMKWPVGREIPAFQNSNST